MPYSDIFRFWRIWIFSDSDIFWFWKILTFSSCEGFWHFPVLKNSDVFRFWHFPVLKDSDIFRFWQVQIQILTFSGFERFWYFQILTFSGSEGFWHFHILTFSSKAIFWSIPILTFSGFERFWHFQILTFSGFERFWHFQILTFSGFEKLWRFLPLWPGLLTVVLIWTILFVFVVRAVKLASEMQNVLLGKSGAVKNYIRDGKGEEKNRIWTHYTRHILVYCTDHSPCGGHIRNARPNIPNAMHVLWPVHYIVYRSRVKQWICSLSQGKIKHLKHFGQGDGL